MISFAPALYARDGVDGQRRRQIVTLLQAALQAVDPAEAVRRTMRREGDRLYVGERSYDLSTFERVLVVGTGKAGASMTQAVEGLLGARIAAGHVNVKYEHSLPTEFVQIHEAGHPIPDAAGVAGAAEIADSGGGGHGRRPGALPDLGRRLGAYAVAGGGREPGRYPDPHRRFAP